MRRGRGSLGGHGVSRKVKGFPARVQKLVRQRADYRCEACGTWVIGRSGGACLPVVRDGSGAAAGVPPDVLSGPANAVLLCAPCAARAEALDPQLEAQGFRVPDGGDPRHLPMTLCRDGQRTVWRSVDGAYLTEPPAL